MRLRVMIIKTTLAEYREKYDLGQREGRIVSMEDDQVE